MHLSIWSALCYPGLISTAVANLRGIEGILSLNPKLTAGLSPDLLYYLLHPLPSPQPGHPGSTVRYLQSQSKLRLLNSEFKLHEKSLNMMATASSNLYQI